MAVIFKSFNGYKLITLKDTGEIIVNENMDAELYKIITEELGREAEILVDFKNPGIPGKIKIKKPYENKQDIINLLNNLRIPFYTCKQTFNNTNYDSNIIDIYDMRIKNTLKNNSIREFDNRYEYCIIENYENMLDEFRIDSIEIENVFVQLLTDKYNMRIVSIEFLKKDFTVSKIASWLHLYSIKLLNTNEEKIENAYEIIRGLRFKGRPIILYRNGKDTLYINTVSFPEITNKFKSNIQRVDTSKSKKIDIQEKLNQIVFNGRRVSYIPEIRIDLTKDLLISNGHIIVATYLGDYSGCVGFFENEGDCLPVAWIHDIDAKIFIDVYKGKNGTIVVVEHSHSIDINTL